MEWMAVIGDSIQYIEEHITDDITTDNIAKAVNVSPFYFQKGFAMLCGYTVGEYIRNRRLTLAANDLALSDDTVLDIARYLYDSPRQLHKGIHTLPRRVADCSSQERCADALLCSAETEILAARRLSYGLQNREKRRIYRDGKCKGIPL